VPADPTLWAEGVRVMRELFLRGEPAPRWPMYLRNVRQYLKAADEAFDERRYGFRGMMDAVRQGQREGLFRVERDRRGIVRVFRVNPQRPAGARRKRQPRPRAWTRRSANQRSPRPTSLVIWSPTRSGPSPGRSQPRPAAAEPGRRSPSRDAAARDHPPRRTPRPRRPRASTPKA
jgi:hypothetical protein